MAQKVNVQLIDDIDGSEAVGTVYFGLDGTAYEIDMNEKNTGALHGALALYVEHARKTGFTAGRIRRVTATQPSTARAASDAAEVRAWLADNGWGDELKEKGRIPVPLREKYVNRIPKSAAPPMPTREDVDAAAAQLTRFAPPVIEPPAEPVEPPAEPVAAEPATTPADDAQPAQRATRAKRKPAVTTAGDPAVSTTETEAKPKTPRGKKTTEG